MRIQSEKSARAEFSDLDAARSGLLPRRGGSVREKISGLRSRFLQIGIYVGAGGLRRSALERAFWGTIPVRRRCFSLSRSSPRRVPRYWGAHGADPDTLALGSS